MEQLSDSVQQLPGVWMCVTVNVSLCKSAWSAAAAVLHISPPWLDPLWTPSAAVFTLWCQHLCTFHPDKSCAERSAEPRWRQAPAVKLTGEERESRTLLTPAHIASMDTCNHTHFDQAYSGKPSSLKHSHTPFTPLTFRVVFGNARTRPHNYVHTDW